VIKKFIYGILILLLGLLALLIACVAPIDYTAYQEQAYYRASLQAMDSLEKVLPPLKGDTVEAGWSKKNITPTQAAKLMGYGWKGEYERVHDSLKVHTIVLTNGVQSVAVISYDLMIVHPDLAKAIHLAVEEADLPLRNIYFSAVHTHNGFGEWAEGVGGLLTAGGYDDELVQYVARQSVASIEEALHKRRPVKIGYAEFEVPALVKNRLIKEGEVDDKLRVIKLTQDSGKTALLCTYSAHATFLNSKRMDLSADYPSALRQYLESDSTVAFASFAAGAVGSHSAVREGEFSYEKMEAYARQLATPLLNGLDSIIGKYTTQLLYVEAPLYMGEPQLKLISGWRVRPWLYHAVLGEHKPYLSGLRLGEINMLGVPADYSGMLYQKLNKHDYPLVVSSFNGNYMGYIIPDEYYKQAHREARELNWYGPYTGSYVTEMMNRLNHILIKAD